MLSVSKDKINSLFEAIAKDKTLYLPVDNASGKANFEKWQKGTKLSEALKTVRSAKDFFFPKTEKMVGYKVEAGNITVEDPRKELDDFVVFGVRACDAKAFDIFDKVYLEMTPTDSYYKNRRDHAVVITLACSEPDKNCFCSSYGLDAANPAGDVSAWLAGGDFYFNANTDKGKKFLDSVKGALKEKDAAAVCPSCMCFDVRDYDTGHGIEQSRTWDSCMYSDFTQMAAANPRLTQKERFRQRFMHKLVYYPMAHEKLFMCVGCGRCLDSCPIHMNIVKVIKAFNEADLGGK